MSLVVDILSFIYVFMANVAWDYVMTVRDAEGVFFAPRVHRLFTGKTQAIYPPTHPLTLLMITANDYQLLYVF